MGLLNIWEDLYAAQKRPRLPLAQALQKYWYHLIGVLLLPPFFLLPEELGLPFALFVIPFFAAMGFAAWPYWKKDAPYSFWLVAMLVWMSSAILSVSVFAVLKQLLQMRSSW